jgi:hypothetical protein
VLCKTGLRVDAFTSLSVQKALDDAASLAGRQTDRQTGGRAHNVRAQAVEQ